MIKPLHDSVKETVQALIITSKSKDKVKIELQDTVHLLDILNIFAHLEPCSYPTIQHDRFNG